LGLSTVDPARHFHSDLTDSAHFGVKRPSGTPQGQKHHSSKSRVDWTFLQILVQSRFMVSSLDCADFGRSRSRFPTRFVVNLPEVTLVHAIGEEFVVIESN